jgi:hypothetical protein
MPIIKQATLARVIEADLLAEKPAAKDDAMSCHACGRPYMYRGPHGDASGRFCSDRCRDAYDAGWPAYDPDIHEPDRRKSNWIPLGKLRVVAGPPVYDPLAGSRQLSRGIKRRGAHGWIIECFGCGQYFDSTGLRCCSVKCERAYLDRQDAIQAMAEVGMEAPTKRKCQLEGCPHYIPNWRNGRRVSQATKFCSPKCQKASKAAL